jgi:hypothetical protein
LRPHVAALHAVDAGVVVDPFAAAAQAVAEPVAELRTALSKTQINAKVRIQRIGRKRVWFSHLLAESAAPDAGAAHEALVDDPQRQHDRDAQLHTHTRVIMS